jgi:hypothetical protein
VDQIRLPLKSCAILGKLDHGTGEHCETLGVIRPILSVRPCIRPSRPVK